MVINIHVFHCQFMLCQIWLKMRKIFSSARVKYADYNIMMNFNPCRFEQQTPNQRFYFGGNFRP